jgi:DNA topoisomerase-1
MVKAEKEMEIIGPEKVGRDCPLCKKPLVYRVSKRTGIQFVGCSDFPKCKYAEFPNSPKPIMLEDKCPMCGKNLVQRLNRRGQSFVGCSGYPACHYIRKVDKNGKIIEFKNTEKKGKFTKNTKTEKKSKIIKTKKRTVKIKATKGKK